MNIDEKLLAKYRHAVEMRFEFSEQISRDAGTDNVSLFACGGYGKAWDEIYRLRNEIIDDMEKQLGIFDMHQKAEGHK